MSKPWGMELQAFCLLMHLSQLSNFVIPGMGIVLPIAMWATQKDSHRQVDVHGKIIFNWMISAFLYGLVCGALTFIFVGVIGLAVLALCNVAFVLIGAVKANQGEAWPYPLSIGFFKSA